MSAKKVFLKSFFYSLFIIIALYIGLLFIINNQPKSQEIDVNKEGVRILTPAVDDSKNILIVLNGFENRFFYILNLNAIQNKVGLLSIESDLFLKETDVTLNESYETAGIMQSSFDLSKEFQINIDYYLSLDYNTVLELSKNFDDVNVKSIIDGMPSEIQDLLLENQEEIDINSLINIISKGENILATSEGVKYFNDLLFFILRDNILKIDDEFVNDFKDNFSYIQTNINSIAIEKLSLINSFFSLTDTQFLQDIIYENDEKITDKIEYLFNK